MAKRMVFLYAGNNANGVAYNYTEAQIGSFTNADEFVIAASINNYLNNDTALNTHLNAVVSLAARTINKTGKHVWLSLPYFPKGSPFTVSTYAPVAQKLISCAATLKQKFNGWMGSNTAFDTYVEGFYIVNEHVDQESGVKLNTSSLTTMKQHPEVYTFATVSDYVKGTLNKKMLWCPYYGTGVTTNDTINSVGSIANKTNIFDYVFIQPVYYFLRSQDIFENLGAIRRSMRDHRVYTRNGTVVGGSKTSNTQIGVQMEIDACYVNGRGAAANRDAATSEDAQNRFSYYADCYNNTPIPAVTNGNVYSNHAALPALSGYSKANAHISFYCGAPLSGNTQTIQNNNTAYSVISSIANNYLG